MMEQELLMGVQQNLEKVLHLVVQAIKFRCFITKENASEFPNLIKFINELTIQKKHMKLFLR